MSIISGSRRTWPALANIVVGFLITASCGDALVAAGGLDSGTTSLDASDANGSLDAGSTCPVDCVPPEHGNLACQANECNFSCDTGWYREGDACLPEPATCPAGEAGQRIPIPSVNANIESRSILGLALSGNTLGITFSENSKYAHLARFEFPSLVHAANSERYSSIARTSFHPAMQPAPYGFVSTYESFGADLGPRITAVLHDFSGTVISEGNLGSSVFLKGFTASSAGIGLLYAGQSDNPPVVHRTNHALENLDAYRTEMDFQGFRAHTDITSSQTAAGYRILGQQIGEQIATAFVSDTGQLSAVIAAFDPLPGRIGSLRASDGPFISSLANGYVVLVHTATVGVFPRVRQWHLGFLTSSGEAQGMLQNIEAVEDVDKVLLASGPDTVALAYMSSNSELLVQTFSNQGVSVETVQISSGLVDIDPDFHLAWTGDRYTIAYAQKGSGAQRMFVRTVCVP